MFDLVVFIFFLCLLFMIVVKIGCDVFVVCVGLCLFVRFYV